MPKVTVQQICDTFPNRECTVNTKGAPASTPWLLTVTEIQGALESGAFTHAQSLVDGSGKDTGRVRVAVGGASGAPFKDKTVRFGNKPQLAEKAPDFPPMTVQSDE